MIEVFSKLQLEAFCPWSSLKPQSKLRCTEQYKSALRSSLLPVLDSVLGCLCLASIVVIFPCFAF